MTNLPSPPPPGANRSILPLVLIIVALAVWGAFLAVGAYLGVSDQVPSYDPRRAGVMLICSSGFLLFWLIALFFRARRS